MKRTVKVYTERVIQDEFEIEVDDNYYNIKDYCDRAYWICDRAREQKHFLNGETVVQIADENDGTMITLDENDGIRIEKL